MIEEVVEHVIVVALRMVRRQADVLIHVVRLHILEGETPTLVELYQLLVHP